MGLTTPCLVWPIVLRYCIERLQVLPYIKENGEQVKGHTKNGPKDGRALPRHPEDYLEIPFSLYDGDLMIGLWGELPYE